MKKKKTTNSNQKGTGKYSWASGPIYEGEWIAGRREGRGGYSSAAEEYSGGWAFDCFSGQGTYLVKATQFSLTGRWSGGAPEGKFLLKLPHTTVQGNFKDGFFVGDHIRLPFCTNPPFATTLS